MRIRTRLILFLFKGLNDFVELDKVVSTHSSAGEDQCQEMVQSLGVLNKNKEIYSSCVGIYSSWVGDYSSWVGIYSIWVGVYSSCAGFYFGNGNLKYIKVKLQRSQTK